jgi:hypothetical protein
MHAPLHIDTSTVALRELTRSQMAISLAFELQQIAALVQAALAEEEERARVRDPSDPQYPMLARSLRDRFSNLQKTITSLQAAA